MKSKKSYGGRIDADEKDWNADESFDGGDFKLLLIPDGNSVVG